MPTAACRLKVDRRPEFAGGIRREYAACPGLSLTVPQARRLWQLQESTCRLLLDGLVAEGFLQMRSDARYVLRA